MNQKFRFTAEPRSALCLLSMALMLLSAAARLWYYLADPVATAMTLSQADIFLLVGLPVFSAALYPVLLALFGRRTIVPLTAPVAGFVVFFLYKALSFSSVLHTVLCTILYLAVLVFFLLTALAHLSHSAGRAAAARAHHHGLFGLRGLLPLPAGAVRTAAHGLAAVPCPPAPPGRKEGEDMTLLSLLDAPERTGRV